MLTLIATVEAKNMQWTITYNPNRILSPYIVLCNGIKLGVPCLYTQTSAFTWLFTIALSDTYKGYRDYLHTESTLYSKGE